MPADPVAAWAASGAMWLTGARGGPPLAAGAGAAVVLSDALRRLAAQPSLRDTGATDPLPDVTLLGERAATAGLRRNAPYSAGGATRAVPAADGWFVMSLARPADRELLPALAADPAVHGWQELQHWAAGRAVGEVVQRAVLLGLPVAAVPDPDTLVHETSRPPVVRIEGGVRRRTCRPRVIDLSALWAGPLCASLLGMFGADVVKVESVRRPDGARQGPPAFFDLLNAGHRSVALDFDNPEGRAALHQLLREADVVVSASRPRALDQLGVDVAELVSSGTTWVAISAYGWTTDGEQRVGFGDDVAMGAGLVGWIDGVPCPAGDAVADPLAGVTAAVEALAALHSERSRRIDVSMHHACSAAAAIGVPDHDVTGDEERGWFVESGNGRVPVALPTARRSRGRAASLGADTAALLRC